MDPDFALGMYTEEIVARFCTFQIILTLLDGINLFQTLNFKFPAHQNTYCPYTLNDNTPPRLLER